MSDIKLSICIPTYNRAPFLRSALECLAGVDFGFAHEIVISDNASTDDTEQLVQSFIDHGLPITYLRMPQNAGAGPNLTNAMHRARGEYFVYQGDDDLLIPDQVAKVIAYLDANPDVSACQAPWYLYDQVEDVDQQKFYQVEEDVKFARQDFLGVFEFLFQGHIFPEIAIYRMAEARRAFVPRYFCFWPFSYLAHFLDQGAVAFLKEPFYRSVTVSKVPTERVQAGYEDVMTGWDQYRGGLEYYLHFAAKRGKLSLTPEARDLYDKMCKIFTVQRMAVAVRFWLARNDYVRAYELYTRMDLAGYGDHPVVADLRQNFPAMVGLQTLAYKINSVPGLDRLILAEMPDIAHMAGLLYDLGLQPDIEVAADGGDDEAESIAATAVLASSSEMAEAFAARGYDPRSIFLEQDLMRFVAV